MTRLLRLSLSQFRNFQRLALDLPPARLVCLHGPNGAGKTNMLEALSQLGPGRGLRGAALGDLARDGAPEEAGWAVSVQTAEGDRLGVGLERTARGARRAVRVNGGDASPSELAERVRLAWLTPDMDGLFRGAASDRRRFVDRLAAAHMPAHARTAAHYEKAMRERNALLDRPSVDPAWADALEEQMARAGAALAVGRARLVDTLQSAVDAAPGTAFPKADLHMEGRFAGLAAEGRSAAEIAEALAGALQRSRARDRAAGRSLEGPHREDLAVTHRPTGAPAAKASTGQQKALLTGLVLASADALAAEPDAPAPLLLLDEAAAHLDAARRGALYERLEALRGQSWLSGTDEALFDGAPDAVRVRVEDGAASL